jgi:hypothetical protein
MNEPYQTICFVCHQQIEMEQATINTRLNLPVCPNCHQTEEEKRAEQEAINSLGEDFVCGCI